MYTVVWYNPETDETIEEDWPTLSQATVRFNELYSLGYIHLWVQITTSHPQMAN